MAKKTKKKAVRAKPTAKRAAKKAPRKKVAKKVVKVVARKATKKVARVAKKITRKVEKKAGKKKLGRTPPAKTPVPKTIAKPRAKVVRKPAPAPAAPAPAAPAPAAPAPAAPAPEPAPASAVGTQVGQDAPDFTLKADDGRDYSLSQFRGRKVVLYFYPKDDTPGCTKEACSFRDGINDIDQKNALVLGVSADDVDSHQKFRAKFSLNFPLLADTERQVVNAYGVWKEKSLYGKTFMGIERTTFVIDEQGRIAKIFPKVKVDGHLAEVLAAL